LKKQPVLCNRQRKGRIQIWMKQAIRNNVFSTFSSLSFFQQPEMPF